MEIVLSLDVAGVARLFSTPHSQNVSAYFAEKQNGIQPRQLRSMWEQRPVSAERYTSVAALGYSQTPVPIIPSLLDQDFGRSRPLELFAVRGQDLPI